MQWISDNAQAINAIAAVLTLLVWLFYAQLLYNGYIRQRRARVIINRGQGKNIESLCLVSNMSAEAIFIQHIVVRIETSQEPLLLDVSDYQQSNDDGQTEYRSHQGPLSSGGYLHIGTFKALIERVAEAHGIKLDGHRPSAELSFKAIELRVIAIYGSEDRPVGARRRFLLNDDGDACSITPAQIDTQRLASRRNRRLVKQWMRNLE
ncbi:hypothetical protein SAMN05192555_101196 [Franzmannia pantelleriensis]|uniref:Uncharacterized protein n=1 Tax=Franzmannia pantelleriensis TaxID=48727 RepID=A0A1G9EQZ0_9GAMM|nr:hypothetical protein [Halomonas pantelleriensis]SDK78498.1 hypothetical protein SAMN05192555_101196 [Halomonas pantelleriensis]